MRKFVGREKELKKLNDIARKGTASFVVVRGRRRIGKSTLIKKFAASYSLLAFEGLPPTSAITAQQQRDEFARQLAAQTDLPEIRADDWTKLFQLLWDKAKKGRVIILFDEISWMGSKDPQFLGKIKMAWDNLFSHNSKLLFIICGSASSWIEKNILSSTGFVGRISHILTLEELPIKESKKLFAPPNISAYERLKLLSITGGVPKYIEELNPHLTAEDNVKQLCFSPGGFFVEEFDRIFSDLFLRESNSYKKIVETLARGPKTMSAISEDASLSKSGRLTDYLKELTLSGFIQHDYDWDFVSHREKKGGTYRLKDNYLRFYLKYIEPNIRKINTNTYAFKSLATLPGWATIMGLQFENIVVNNKNFIHDLLGIDPNDIMAANPYIQKATKQKKGVQVDYLIQARFNTFYLCEIKYSHKPIGKGVVQEIQDKINHIKTPKHSSFRPVLIHAGQITEELEESQYFYKIIDFTTCV